MKHKHKKTRKEKILADYRHRIYTFENKNIQIPTPVTAVAILNTNPYSHVFRDVLKTGILTFLIIAGQLILFFLLKRHVFTIPGINY